MALGSRPNPCSASLSLSLSLCRALRRAVSTTAPARAPAPASAAKAKGDISAVFPSLSGKKAEPLPPRFAQLKLERIRGRETALQQSWARLLASLNQEIREIRHRGSNVIPTLDFSQVAAHNVPSHVLAEIRRRGSAVIRNVIPREHALDLKAKAKAYIAANRPNVNAFPADDPAVYELYWTPSQVAARAHPNVLATQRFLASLWHSSDPKSPISTSTPLTYADRFRIRNPGDGKFALGPHADGGSLERWEDGEYASVYQAIFDGHWEEYDAFDANHRIHAKMDMYNCAGGCSAFRLFQGWLSMSDTGPGEGTLKICPMLKHATAYSILRPFFDLTSESSLSYSPPKIQLDLSPSFPNSVPGAGQEYSPDTHPHLRLDETMVSVPRVAPGDFVAWHCDTIHAVDKQHAGKTDSSVMYIPAVAMTPRNVEFMIRQREAALKWAPPPDFPGAGSEEGGERGFVGAVRWDDAGQEEGGLWSKEGLQSMGLGKKRWQVTRDMSEGERKVIEDANRACFGTAAA